MRISVPDADVRNAKAAFEAIVKSLDSGIVGLRAAELAERTVNARAREEILKGMSEQIERLKLLLT